MKENRGFTSYPLFYTKKHEIFLKPQYKCTEVPQSSNSTYLSSVPCFLGGILNPQIIRINKMVKSVNSILVLQE